MITETPELCVTEISLLPEEKLQQLVKGGRELTIAVLKNVPVTDTRVPLTPMACHAGLLCDANNHIAYSILFFL